MSSSRLVPVLVVLLCATSLGWMASVEAAPPSKTSSQTGVTYSWRSSVAWGIQGESTSVVTGFTMPANATSFAAFVNWTSQTTDLDVALLDASGATRCQSSGHATSAVADVCAGVRGASQSDEAWRLEVIAYTNVIGTGPLKEDFLAVASLTYSNRVVAPPGDILPPVPVGHARSSFATGVVDAVRKTGEPGIDVVADGTVYVNAPYSSQSALWRSTDNGATFAFVPIHGTGGPTDAGTATNQFPSGGGDSDFEAWDTQDLYFGDLWGCLSVSASHDGGATWFTNPVSCDVPLTSDRQWLALDGPQSVYMGYNGFNGFTVGHSSDGGLTWSNANIPEDNCSRGNIALGPEHNVYGAGCNANGPGVATSTDGGKTFTWHVVTTSATCPCNIFDVVTVDRAGNVYLVWSDADSGTLDVWMSSSQDAGSTWSAPTRVNGVTGSHVLPWAVAAAAGELDVVWYGSTEPNSDSATVTGDWYAHFARTTNALDASPVFTESLLWDTPVQHGGLCVSGTGCSGGRNLLDYFQIALDPTGHAHVAFADGRAGGTASNTVIMQATQLD